MGHKIIGVAIAAASGWMLIYIGFWLEHSGCFAAFSLACNNAPYEPLRYFFMLDWFYHYQNLLAGALTGLGAFSGLLVYRWQRDDENRTKLQELRGVRINKLTELGLAFSKLQHANGRRATQQATEAIEQLQVLSDEILDFAPGLTHWLNGVVGELRERVVVQKAALSVYEAAEYWDNSTFTEEVSRHASWYFRTWTDRLVNNQGRFVPDKIVMANFPEGFPEPLKALYRSPSID